jgi:hypothetical protein
MPGKASDRGADIALDAITGRQTQTARTMYLVLLTAAPTDATTLATMVEYTAAGYARQTWTPAAPSASGGNRRSANTNGITYGPLTGANGTTAITHAALVSALTGTTGDLTFYWTLDSPRTPASGDSITVAANAVAADLD